MPFTEQDVLDEVGAITQAPDWQQPEKRGAFVRDVAVKTRADIEPDFHSAVIGKLWDQVDDRGWTRKATDFVGTAVAEVVKSMPALGGAVAFAAGDAVGLSDSGSGSRLKEGVKTLTDATGQRLKQAMPGASEQSKRDDMLEALRGDLSAGALPPEFDQWLGGEYDNTDIPAAVKPLVDGLVSGYGRQAVLADHGDVTPEKLRAWQETDRNPGRSGGDIPGQPGPRELLADYAATKDPASWAAFKSLVTETDAQHEARLSNWVAGRESERTMKAMPEGLMKELTGRSLDMQGSPIDLATALLPALRGAKALNAARKGGMAAAGARVLVGGGKEAVQEGGTELLSDPRATAAQVAEAAGMGAVGSTVLEGGMAGVGAGLNRLSPDLQTPQASGQPSTETRGQNQPPVNVSPVPVSEDLGELTAAEVADLEEATIQDSLTVQARAPILTNVPDRVDATFQSGPGITDAEPGSSASSVPAPAADALGQPVSEVASEPAPLAEVSQPVPLELMTSAQAAELGVNMDVQAARQRYESARAANDPREGMLAEAAITAAQAGTGRNAQRVQNGRMAAVDQAVAEKRPVNAAALEQWAQVPVEGAGFDASGNIPRRGIPAGYQKDGDVYTAALGATSPDARVPVAAETSGQAGVQPAGEAVQASAMQVLRAANDTLPEQGRAVWTPEVYAAAEEYYQTGEKAPLLKLTPIQRRRVIQAGLEADPVARAEQERADRKGEHKIRSQEKRDAAFEQKTTFKNLKTSGSTAGFVNTEVLAEAQALLVEGVRDFANWSRAMVTRFGQAIRDFLQGIWEQVSAALPNDAAKNVRLGSSAKAAPVGLAQGGFVMGPNRVEETRARFASPEQQERLYQVREDVTVKAAAEAWVDSMPMAEAVAAMEAGRLPADMTGDVAQHAAGLLIQRTTEMMKSNQEVVQMQARSLGHRISKVWQGWLSQEAGRNLRQRSVVNSELTPYAPILAAEGMLIDRADAVMDKRYEGGAEGAATKVNETADKAGGEASTELTQDLEADTPVTGESSVAREMREARKARALKKHPSLKRMLDALRKKLYPGMKWADIFMDLPSAQKDRQREIYRRLMLDERLKGLSKDERLALTNELDKAWQQERRKVFLRELERVGIGEKAAADKAKVVKALPKLIRLINLGMMNSEMFREAVAPEYGLKQITTGQALALRKLAEEAYALPEGVLRSRKLAALLDGIQKSTGTGLPEVLNQYWVAAVLSGMRTQFDTFMSLTNGFGNQLIQSGMLAIKNGNRAAAMVSMLEWWRGLKQAFPEAMQILSKGDYSYLKRFNDDLRKALEGETTFRPVPLGEALWRDGNAMEKYGFAPVMIWTGRLMAAADHLNNSATTAGAKVVARALHPELYKTVAASPSEREAAAVQARREVTGGAMPATAQDRATVAARTREILNGQLRPEEVKEAAFMGDQAAYQNDPTGVFGGIYRAVNQGLGTLERGLQAYAEERGADGPAGRYARGMMLFFSGAMRSMMGAKFIRFGANFGNDMLGYVPGTVLVSPALLGAEATRSQKQLLLGKNVFGLMAGLTVAAMFLGKDDEEDGWHLEGPWSDLTPEEVKQRRAAGFEPLTFWKRGATKVERVSFKQWPTAGLLAGVAHMQDRQRFRPEKWAREGMAGHLLAAATVGAFQVKDVSAMRGLADLLGASKFGTNPEEAFVEKMAKMPINFAGGFIPTLAKDLDALADSRRYKPETVMEEFLRNVPLARRAVAGGRPEINILGVAIEQDRKPWSRAYTDAESGPAHAVLGSLSARGFTLPTPETNRKVWKDGAWSTIAAMGADAEWRYQKKVGDGYRAWLGSSEGRALLTMPDGLAVQKLINRQADTIKRQALQAVMK